jgi:hypothetical protein
MGLAVGVEDLSAASVTSSGSTAPRSYASTAIEARSGGRHNR